MGKEVVPSPPQLKTSHTCITDVLYVQAMCNAGFTYFHLTQLWPMIYDLPLQEVNVFIKHGIIILINHLSSMKSTHSFPIFCENAFHLGTLYTHMIFDLWPTLWKWIMLAKQDTVVCCFMIIISWTIPSSIHCLAIIMCEHISTKSTLHKHDLWPLTYCIRHYFRVQLFFAVLARCGNSRVVNFAILLMLSLL